MRWKYAPKLMDGDHRKMRWRFKQGQTYAAIARAFCVSNTTARVVVMREIRRQEGRVRRYLKERAKRKYAWTPEKQWMEFEMNRGEG
jgi:IS30 family transposase